jgi:hypothetical protein
MQYLHNLAYQFFDINSFWSVIFRGIIWVLLSIIILIATDHPSPEESRKNVKSYLGFFLLFAVVSTSMILLLFGISPA